MLRVNADDYGRSGQETDAVVACDKAGRLTSASAMVFMADSGRAAQAAAGLKLDIGLHLNLSERFSAPPASRPLVNAHDRIVRFLSASKYAVVLYHPLLKRDFRIAVEAQLEEFARRYGRAPSHIDGHQHMHLSLNVLLDGLIPAGSTVRRSFSFEKGEKGALNRRYRRWIDRRLERTYQTSDFFFNLDPDEPAQLDRVFQLAEGAAVELMTHPVRCAEFTYLMSEEYLAAFQRLRLSDRAVRS
jgi:chitin disaccharide deacetylase